jgi:hypothetical protein
MKALMCFYVLVWIYAVYYSVYMLYRLLGNDSIPFFVAFGLLFVIKWVVGYIKLRG